MPAYADSTCVTETERMAYSPRERLLGNASLNAKSRLLYLDNNTARRTKASDNVAKENKEQIEG